MPVPDEPSQDNLKTTEAFWTFATPAILFLRTSGIAGVVIKVWQLATLRLTEPSTMRDLGVAASQVTL
jgi:hypothetical protein